MTSKLMFDLDELNNPIIRMQISKEYDDLRDKVAKRFASNLEYGNICSIKCNSTTNDGNQYEIRPIPKLFIPYKDLEEEQHKIINTDNCLLPKLTCIKTDCCFYWKNPDKELYLRFKEWEKNNPAPYTFEFQDPNDLFETSKNCEGPSENN